MARSPDASSRVWDEGMSSKVRSSSSIVDLYDRDSTKDRNSDNCLQRLGIGAWGLKV